MSTVLSNPKQTFIGIWFHDNNLSNDGKEKMKLYLSRAFYYYIVFTGMDEFSKYISNKRRVAKIFLIISHLKSYSSLIELVKSQAAKFLKFYIFLPIEVPSTDCFTTSDMEVLFEELSRNILEHINKKNPPNTTADKLNGESDGQINSDIDRILPSVNVFKPELQQKTPIRHLTKESLNFLCFLTMINILLGISSYTDEDLLEMLMRCRDLYNENQAQLDHIDHLSLPGNYNGSDAITYYTGESWLSRTVNQACHTENMREIFTFRVYISDLHKQLVQCYKRDERNNSTPSIDKLYRGKPLSGSVLQQLIDNEGGLISMNGFLSTSMFEGVASSYHGDDQVRKLNDGYTPVLFRFEINTIIKQPYAYIAKTCSTKPDEEEVLFSPGTIWRVKSVSVKPTEERHTVELISCDELDRQLTEILKKYSEEDCDLSSIGDILCELGNDGEAEWFYEKMLQQHSLGKKTRAYLHNKIGKMRLEKKDYSVALWNFERAAELLRSSSNELNQDATQLPLYSNDEHSPLIAIYYNMGSIHEKNCNFKKAIHCYKKALKMKGGSKLEMAIVHNRLGCLYFRRSNYNEAQKHHTAAVEITDKNELYWVEFNKNLSCANQRCQHIATKKQSDEVDHK